MVPGFKMKHLTISHFLPLESGHKHLTFINKQHITLQTKSMLTTKKSLQIIRTINCHANKYKCNNLLTYIYIGTWHFNSQKTTYFPRQVT